MKKLLIIGLLAASTYIAGAATLATNLAASGVYLLSTNRASVYSVEITSQSPTMLSFYDCDFVGAPIYGTNTTNGAWVSRNTYATNYVSSFVGYNGYTNWYTNAGVWTLTTTNSATTNQLPVMFSAVTAGNTYAVYNVDALFARGITVLGNPCTNVSVVINYRSAQ